MKNLRFSLPTKVLQFQKKEIGSPILTQAVSVFNIVVAFCFLTFNGIPRSDDEEFFASAARNLAIFGRLSVGQLYGNLRIKGEYHGVEPAYSALVSIWYRLFLSSDFGHLQSLYVLPVICTGLTAALIVFISYQLGFSKSSGVIAGLLYGLSTMAWPYAKTLFREPLIAFLLLSSLSIFLYLFSRKLRLWCIVLTALLLLILLVTLTFTRVTMGMATIGLFVTVPYVYFDIKGNKKRITLFILIGTVFFLSIAIILSMIRLPDSNIFYRFSSTLVHDAFTRMMNISHTHFAEAFLAPLLSPWKGLFLYSPICLLGFLSSIINIRRRPELFILPAIVLLTLLLSQALAYDNEWWTPTWGIRFLVPVIPLMTLSALPILQRWIDRGRRGYILIAGLFSLGFAIQLPAILFNSSEYMSLIYPGDLGAVSEKYIWSIVNTPIINQWKLVNDLNVQQFDFLIGRTVEAQPILTLLIILMCLILIIISALLLHHNHAHLPVSIKRAWIYVSCSSIIILALTVLLLTLGKSDPAYLTEEFKPLCSYIHNHVKAGEITIVQPYPSPVWQYLMNSECGQGTWYSLPYDTDISSNADTRQLVSNLTTQVLPSEPTYWLIEQFWSDPIPFKTQLITSVDHYQLMAEAYFYAPFKIFIGYYVRQ